jgi:hypothetical protein
MVITTGIMILFILTGIFEPRAILGKKIIISEKKTIIILKAINRYLYFKNVTPIGLVLY